MSSSHTPSKPEIFFLYLAALFQGMSFSIVPGAANFLTANSGLHFSEYEYGNLFILMIFGAIFASFFGSILAKSLGSKPILTFGLFLNALAMGCFALEKLFFLDINISYPLFLLLMFFLGSGFGACLCTLNNFAYHFFPKKQSTAITALHSFLGIGSALGHLLFLLFFKLGCWHVAPLLLTLSFFCLTLAVAILFSKPNRQSTSKAHSNTFSILLVVFALTALLYGFSETLFGNWGTIYLHQNKQLSLEASSYALSLFWGAVTASRLLITFIVLKIKAITVYLCLAPVILISLIFLAFSQRTEGSLLAFLIAGIGCSGFLPLTFSFAQSSFPKDSQKVAGQVSSFYMVGYGLASWGVGAMVKSWHTNLFFIFNWAPVIILGLGILSFFIWKANLKKERG